MNKLALFAVMSLFAIAASAQAPEAGAALETAPQMQQMQARMQAMCRCNRA